MKDFCGTFYYYEGDSDIFLQARDILIAPNKICALTYFLGIDRVIELLESNLDDFSNILTEEETFEDKTLDSIELMISYLKRVTYPKQQWYEELFMGTYRTWREMIEAMITGRFDFLSHNWRLYAFEDRFDQILCRLAGQKFELVILTTMTGKERVVSEILDTRGRGVSLNSLIRLEPITLRALRGEIAL